VENERKRVSDGSRAAVGALKAIYFLSQEHGDVTTCLLATYFGFAPPSVTGMVQKLAKLNLVH
jgi:Mn-dependent DtxR family transcriptional regulator